MHGLFRFVICGCLIAIVAAIMLKKLCPPDESHKSCSYYDEYVCWVKGNRLERVMTSPKRLTHCKSGCFCKRGYVRDFPGGGCILAAGCQDHRLRDMISKLPDHRPTIAFGNEW